MLCTRLLHMQIMLLRPTWLVLRANWLVPRPTIRLRATLLLLRAGRLAHTPTSIRTARLQLVVHACLLLLCHHLLLRLHLVLPLQHMRG